MSKTVNTLIEAFGMMQHGKSLSKIAEKLQELDMCKVKVYREDDSVILPTYAHNSDACMDIYVKSIEIKHDKRIIYHTGLHFKLPEDYEMELRPRSSNTKTVGLMTNAPGTLDSSYTGELMIVQRNLDGSYTPQYEAGDRVAQLLIRRRERVVWDEVKSIEELGNTDRKDGGFGSTGK